MTALTILLAMSVSTFGADQADPAFNWDQWRHLPVQDDGRRKPLDTLARETLRRIHGRECVADPNSGRELKPAAAYLAMLLQWQGWDPSPNSAAKSMTAAPTAYFQSHRADKWDRAALLPVDHVKLREALGMAKDRKSISPLELGEAEIRDPNTGKHTPFGAWVGKLYQSKREGFDPFEKEALQLAQNLSSFQAVRMGRGLEVIPVKGDKDQQWLSLAELMRRGFDDESDPAGELRKVKRQFRDAQAAYLANSAESFNEASAALIATLRRLGPQLGDYPDQTTIGLEVTYNDWRPVRFAWVFTLVAFLSFLLSVCFRWKAAYIWGLAALGMGLAATIVGLGMRTLITARAPVTNLYESVVFAGSGTLIFGLVFGLRSRRQSILAAAAMVGTIALVLADFCPSVLDPRLRPLMPVLRSNFWLAVHVMTIMLSYAAFALALGIGNVTLGYYLVGSKRHEAINAQSRFTYKSLQAGVLLLLVGTILGALWADYSWGRFWGWDPKEVWALITLLGYLAILHARCAGFIGNLGLAALSVICFTLVLMAWYGVNFLSGGLHNYGLSGESGPFYVLSVVGLQLLYATASILKGAGRNLSPSSQLS